MNPSKKITGRNTIASVIDVDKTAKKISLLPSNAALRIGRPLSNFLKMFLCYNNTIVHHHPVASTMPSNVSTFIVKPEMYIIKKVDISEIGISIKGRMAISQLRKK
jgi:hypothetical protein